MYAILAEELPDHFGHRHRVVIESEGTDRRADLGRNRASKPRSVCGREAPVPR
jgi:hypothetical protein